MRIDAKLFGYAATLVAALVYFVSGFFTAVGRGERAVRFLTGVKGIANLIAVKPKASAFEVKAKIESAFKRSAELDAQKINVETADGRVTLRGTVRSWTERQEAERAAWNAPGVREVNDQLTLSV